MDSKHTWNMKKGKQNLYILGKDEEDKLYTTLKLKIKERKQK